MASYNRVILMGNITRDVELRYTPSNMAVTDIGLAVNDKRKTASGEWVDEVTFVDITLWGRNAEIVSQYLSKGSPLLVEGRLKLDTWEKDGKKNSKLKVVGEFVRMLGGKGDGRGGGGSGEGHYERSDRGGQAPARSGGGRPYQQAPAPDHGGDDYSQSPPDSYGDKPEDIPF